MNRKTYLIPSLGGLFSALSLIFLPLISFNVQVMFVQSGEKSVSVYKLGKLFADYASQSVYCEPSGAFKKAVISFAVFLITSFVFATALFIMSLIFKSNGVSCVLSGLGCLSFIISIFVFLKMKTLLMSGEAIVGIAENAVQVHNFSLSRGFMAAFVIMIFVFIFTADFKRKIKTEHLKN